MMVLYAALLVWLGLATATFIPRDLEKRASAGGTCSSPEFEGVVKVGGAGTAFCESSWGTTYLPVTNVTVWSNDQDVTGLQLTYSDGSLSPILGGQAQRAVGAIGVNYGKNDIWSRVSMYTVSGQYVRHLLMQTSGGDKFNGGENVASDPNLSRYDQPVGSGLLFGVTGTTLSNGNIGSLGFLFLASPISTIRVQNVTFTNGLIGSSQSINPTTIGSAHFYNSNSGSNVTYQFNNQLSETQSWMFAQAYTQTFTTQEAIAFNLGFSFLGITIGGSSTTTFIWTDTTMSTTTTSVSMTEQVQYNAAITLAPGQGVDCVAIAGQGSGSFPYNSVVTITLKNGNSYTFPQSGVLTASCISQGTVECSAANHP